MSQSYLFTSESVSEGHPDKVADQISDAILDELLKQDARSRVACETLVKSGLIVIAGEITSKGSVDYAEIARQVVKDIGYTHSSYGLDYRGCGVMTAVDRQSPDIAMGVNEGEGLDSEQGAGDQGMMFGFACDETEELMPASIQFSHQLLQNLAKIRHQEQVDWLRPDAKSQVTVEYVDNRLKRVDTVVISTQHGPQLSQPQIKDFVVEEVVKKTLPSYLLKDTKYFINPTGRFVIGGPQGDAGLTGRKIIVDTYGGHGAHGGGAFSGKDPSKVDRAAAYVARYVAKNIVAAGLARKCLVQLAYAIGLSTPVSIFVDSYGTSRHSNEKLAQVVSQHFALKPRQIIDHLRLERPIYRPTATYGHFGKKELPWEALDKVDELKSIL